LTGIGSGTAHLGHAGITLRADSSFELGQLTTRLQAALWCEWLQGEPGQPNADGTTVTVTIARKEGPYGIESTLQSHLLAD
jgi:coenzyme F420-0:L-glutamate ligase/coenzyme F420-1:gamma-L-glutamate ligase